MDRRKRTCAVQIILTPYDLQRLNYHRRNETPVKQHVVNFIKKLYDRGYRHFMVYVNTLADYWLAELLHFMSRSDKYNLEYSMYIWEKGDNSVEWIDNEYYFEDVISGAKHVYCRRTPLQVYDNEICLLDLTGELKYDTSY